MNQCRRAVKHSLVAAMLESQTIAVARCNETGSAGLRSFYSFVSENHKVSIRTLANRSHT